MTVCVHVQVNCVCVCVHKLCVIPVNIYVATDAYKVTSHWCRVCCECMCVAFVDMVTTVFATCDLRFQSVHFLKHMLYMIQITSMTGINTVIVSTLISSIITTEELELIEK